MQEYTCRELCRPSPQAVQAAECAVIRPAKRLSAKTPPPARQQQPLSVLPDFAAGEEAGKKKQVYLVTLPHPHQPLSSTGVQLLPPGDLTHTQLLDCVRVSCLHPLYVDAYSRKQGFQVRLKQATVCKELHQPDAQGSTFAHFHVALLAENQFRFAAIKKTLISKLSALWSRSGRSTEPQVASPFYILARCERKNDL